MPKEGRLRIQFLSNKQQVRQGVDIKMDGGCLLADGTRVLILRTWDDEGYEPVVEYDYLARDGLIRTWNVYERQWPRGETTEEKWTGNAGMRVEMVSPQERIYHCSAGHLSRPDFESLVYRLTILT